MGLLKEYYDLYKAGKLIENGMLKELERPGVSYTDYMFRPDGLDLVFGTEIQQVKAEYSIYTHYAGRLLTIAPAKIYPWPPRDEKPVFDGVLVRIDTGLNGERREIPAAFVVRSKIHAEGEDAVSVAAEVFNAFGDTQYVYGNYGALMVFLPASFHKQNISETVLYFDSYLKQHPDIKKAIARF